MVGEPSFIVFVALLDDPNDHQKRKNDQYGDDQDILHLPMGNRGLTGIDDLIHDETNHDI